LLAIHLHCNFDQTISTIRLKLIDITLYSLFAISRFLLDPPQKLVFLSFSIHQVIICQIGVFLFQLTFNNIPVSFPLSFVHD